jgi:dynein heavy chain
MFQRILLLRALRPDRLTSALQIYVSDTMGERYIEQMPFDMTEIFAESNNKIPVFFVLFPGYDPTGDVEKIGKVYDKSIANGKFINISMGQGQEDIAVAALEKQAAEGNWVMLHNLHLMQSWLKTLELTLEKVTPTAHEDFRVFFSSEKPPLPYYQIIPEPIMQNCIKVANEAP